MNRHRFHPSKGVAVGAICATLVGCAIQPTWSPSSRLVPDPAQAQRAREIQACKAAMWMRPTRTGNMGETLGNVAQCDIDPRAALAPMPSNPPTPPEGSSGIGGPAFYKGEARSGFNKICYYDRLGSMVAITIPVMQMCPQTLE